MSLLRLPSFATLDVGKQWAWVPFFHGWGCKTPSAVLFFSPGVLNHLTFLLPPFRVLLWLSLVLFPGFTAVVNREEQREDYLCHIFCKGSQMTVFYGS